MKHDSLFMQPGKDSKIKLDIISQRCTKFKQISFNKYEEYLEMFWWNF